MNEGEQAQERLRQEKENLRKLLDEAVRARKRQAGPFMRRKHKEHPQKPGRKAGHAGAHRELPELTDGPAKVGPELCQCPFCRGAVTDRT